MRSRSRRLALDLALRLPDTDDHNVTGVICQVAAVQLGNCLGPVSLLGGSCCIGPGHFISQTSDVSNHSGLRKSNTYVSFGKSGLFWRFSHWQLRWQRYFGLC